MLLIIPLHISENHKFGGSITPPYSSPGPAHSARPLQKSGPGAFFWSSKFNENLDTSWEPSLAGKMAILEPKMLPSWAHFGVMLGILADIFVCCLGSFIYDAILMDF